jgi:hypothetical protein
MPTAADGSDGGHRAVPCSQLLLDIDTIGPRVTFGDVTAGLDTTTFFHHHFFYHVILRLFCICKNTRRRQPVWVHVTNLPHPGVSATLVERMVSRHKLMIASIVHVTNLDTRE